MHNLQSLSHRLCWLKIAEREIWALKMAAEAISNVCVSHAQCVRVERPGDQNVPFSHVHISHFSFPRSCRHVRGGHEASWSGLGDETEATPVEVRVA